MQSASRLLSSPLAKLALNTDENALHLAREIRRRSRSRSSRVCSLVGKIVLVYALANACSIVLFGQFPALWQLVQNTEYFSRSELVYNQLVRRLTVALGLHSYEVFHARERVQCLLPNPLRSQPLLCCPCSRYRLVEASSGKLVRNGFDRLFDRMVTPFVYGNNSQQGLDFPGLRSILAANWKAIKAGSNRMGVLWSPPGPASTGQTVSMEDLFQLPASDSNSAAAEPPAHLAASWLFGHLPAIRALRDTVRRPDHVPNLAEDIFARQFVFLGAGMPAGEAISLGDLQVIRGLAHAFVLHGKVTLSLALKPECCPEEVSRPDYRNLTRLLGPGDVLGFMTDCYWVSLAKAPGSADGSYAIAYFGAVYNGIHPTESSGARKKNKKHNEEKKPDKM